MLKSPTGSEDMLYHSVKSPKSRVEQSPVTYKSSLVLEESDSMKLWDPIRPRGVPGNVLVKRIHPNQPNHLPRSPNTFPSRFSTEPVAPPMENPGVSDKGLPTKTVPIIARAPARSKPMP